jgi:ketosteroid isomerase-like protein
MTDRREIERLLDELYAARLRGDLQGVLDTFADDAKLEIAGATYTSPMTIHAVGNAELRTWLALLVKTFQLSERQVLALAIDGPRAAVHWRAKVRSRVTGVIVPTELIDVINVREGRIASYTEFFVPRWGLG